MDCPKPITCQPARVLALIVLFSLIGRVANAQLPANGTSCGQKEINDQLFRTHPEIHARHVNFEQQLRTYLKNKAGRATKILSNPSATPLGAAIVTLPVVIHIIHNGGPENISDAQVLTAIQHLNEAYANSGFYDPADGVNTYIQFCMAERDPANNATNGITRDVSPYTVMGGPDYYSDDQNVKNIRRWNPECYVNIWVVKSIPGSVVGYAYLPAAHGTNLDGIVLEAGYFGSSYPNDVVIAHEMGHYLGLYHTFEGGCTNNDCSVDGDQVCDTPPDQSTAGIACGSSMNSCTTDVLSGFATDQPDLTQDYMDYGNFNCMKVFTQGQSDRMNWYIQNVRSSLLHCKSCLPPCPSPVTAAFSSPGPTVNAGSAYSFLNGSVNAASYAWKVNGIFYSSTTNLTYTFGAPGTYTITLVALSGNPLCDSADSTITFRAVCPVAAAFTKSATTVGAGSPINFTNTSANATGYEWFVNGVLQSTATNYSYTTTSAGTYVVSLKATNAAASCAQTFSDTVNFTCPVTADFTPPTVTTLLNTSLTFNYTGSGASGFQWKVNGSAAGSGNQITYPFTSSGTYSVQLIATNGVCSAVKNGVVYVADKCGNAVYLFRKNYTTGNSFPTHDLLATSDGGSLTIGKMTIGATTAGALLKLDVAGNLQWNKTYGNGNSTDLIKVKNTLDGGYIAIGNITAGGGNTNLFIVKTASDGTLTWSRQLNLDGGTNGTNIVQSAEGDYYFTGTIGSVGSAGPIAGLSTDLLIGKVNGAGSLVWIQSYDERGSETPNGIAAEPTTVIICGNAQNTKGNQGFLLQVSKTDGSVTWSKTYQSANENFRDVLPSATGYFVDVLRSASAALTYTDHVYLATDASGNVTYSQFITPFGAGTAIGFSSLILKPNGHIVSQTTPTYGGVFEDFLIQEVDPATGIVWSKKYNEANTWITGLGVKPDQSFYAGGFTSSPGPLSPFLLSVDSAGGAGTCPANNATLQLIRANYLTNQVIWTSKFLQAAFSGNLAAADQLINVNTECQYVSCDSVVDSCALCQTLQVKGKDSICGIKNLGQFSALRDSGCTLPVKWIVDTNYVNVISMTDSTIFLSVKQSGKISLIGSLITPCKTINDTLSVQVFRQPDSVNLGPDLLLCKLSAIQLRAGSGFANYTWQDGSVDSTLTAYFPGQYFVNATDYCGNNYGDTIIISEAPDVPFDLGHDTTICWPDTLQLSAPTGFASYSWSPVYYNIDSPYSRTPLVYPAKDTTYTCVAERYPGCSVIDSIHITVLRGVIKNFLADSASFCVGTTLPIVPTGVWKNYLWSDGSTGPSIQVSAPGLYWLMVTDSSQCTGRDSIIVNEMNCRRSIHFPSAFTPNSDGKNDLFRAILQEELPFDYTLVIYNRWGEKVFETRNPLGGWNGTLNGLPQEMGGFVWYSVFQFTGDAKPIMMKGTVMLIR